MKTPQICLIYAHAKNQTIGKGGQLPWYLPEDLMHFKTMTLHQPVIMGRKTWDSLPLAFRPLPHRRNIVISRNEAWYADGVEKANGVQEAIALCQGAQTVWVIGGATLYQQALPLASRIEATEIDLQIEDGDAFAPQLDATWHAHTQPWQTSSRGIRYRFVTWSKT